MATANFVKDQTVIEADWLNDVDYMLYTVLGWETNFGEGATLADGEMLVGNGTRFVIESGNTLADSVLGAIGGDLRTLGAPASDGQFIVATGAGAFAYESGATVRTSLGLVIGTDVQAWGAVLDDFNTLGAAASDGQIIVATGAGAFAYESGATARTSLGLGTGDSPQFTGIEVGHATDTTVTRLSAGDIQVEANRIFRVGGTDVPVADGGTGASTAAAARTNLGADGNLVSVQVFTTTGANTWTKPSGVIRVVMEVQAAGGGGGGSAADAASSGTNQAAGGGGGGYSKMLLDVSAIASSTVTVGAAGTAGSAGNNAGGTGGNSIWADGTNTITANGGVGGAGSPDGGDVDVAGGAGGTATGGDVNISGEVGGTGAALNAAFGGSSSSRGGNSVLGSGAARVAHVAAAVRTGNAGSNYGGGGSGGRAHVTNTAAAGGAGAQGIVIVWEVQ